MRTDNIVFFGTCQAQALCKIYNSLICNDTNTPAVFVSSNIVIGGAELKALSDATLIVNQLFSFKQVSTVAGESLKATIIDFPYLAGWFLWPYSSEDHVRRRYFPNAKQRPYDAEIGDAFLNRQITRGTSVENAVDQYMCMNIIATAHIERRTQLIFDQQKQREVGIEVKAARYIEENVGDPSLFLTRGHPGLPLLLHVASQVFDLMDIPRSAIDRLPSTLLRVPDHQNQAAIHPAIARHFGIRSTGPDRLYAQFAGHYTFEEYCRRYMQYEWNQDLVEGIYFVEVNQFDQALQSLTLGLKQVPRSASGHHAFGRVLDRYARFDEAADAFRVACDLDPRNPGYFIHYSNFLIRRGDLAEADAVLRKALALRPNLPELNMTLSHLLTKREEIPAAIAAADLAVAYSAKVAPILPHLARLLVRDRNFDRAFQVLAQAIALRPDDASLYHGLADALLQAGRPAEALEKCKDAISLAPVETRYRAFAAEILNRLGRWEDAIASYQSVLDINPQHRGALIGLVYLLARVGDVENSIKHNKLALDQNPGDASLLAHMGSQLARLGRYEEAATAYLDALIIDARLAHTHFSLSRAFAHQSRIDEAICAVMNACNLEPNNKEFGQHLEDLIASRRRSMIPMRHAANSPASSTHYVQPGRQAAAPKFTPLLAESVAPDFVLDQNP